MTHRERRIHGPALLVMILSGLLTACDGPTETPRSSAPPPVASPAASGGGEPAPVPDAAGPPGHVTAEPAAEDPPAPDPVDPPSPSLVAHGDTWTNSLGMELIYVAPGEFVMGSPRGEEGRQPDETQHVVVLTRGFWISATEVTQAQWMAVTGVNRSHFQGADRPVDSVSWTLAKDFCDHLGEAEGRRYRLPTEAEWEYACRAGTLTVFAFGDTVSSHQANLDGSKPYGDSARGTLRGETLPVGSFPPNAWGLYDTHGNAWELCEDWYGEAYGDGSPRVDPRGPETGERRVVRGGSWRGSPRLARSAHRHRTDPDLQHFYFGFRVVLEVAGPGDPAGAIREP